MQNLISKLKATGQKYLEIALNDKGKLLPFEDWGKDTSFDFLMQVPNALEYVAVAPCLEILRDESTSKEQREKAALDVLFFVYYCDKKNNILTRITSPSQLEGFHISTAMTLINAFANYLWLDFVPYPKS